MMGGLRCVLFPVCICESLRLALTTQPLKGEEEEDGRER